MASITVKIDITGTPDTGMTVTYSEGSKEKGGGKSDPSVDATGEVTVYTGTDVKFKLETDGYTFPSDGSTLIEIDGTDMKAGDNIDGFKIGDDQPDDSGKTLKVHDEDNDGTPVGVLHPYCLYVMYDGTSHKLDPNFRNRS
jgi:hypothetical protein